ncbi:hypothetical protein SAMN04490243_2696 [Robiginitalea myxolifaciens]|uniref:Uncharacterized protein n=1 Tax=Robiginitalea myxolifaciens TaxID=400055 RepID=A0A1I6HFQ4_9FLAO|nr:hypothetical protein [Robiginitalea myxolifaciens]SFR53326.1 hypothetical protein SAMN04490243_2696 [Robiginitalea myxolifaciens]
MKLMLAGILMLALNTGGDIPLQPEECSVTATGWVESAEYGSFQTTLTVTGPCDSSLADILRQAIADLRGLFK